MTHPGWRPPFYETKEELEAAIEGYFKITPENEIAITWLALHLWFSERKSLIDYAENPEFVHTIKKAKMRVELAYEKRLIARGNWGDVFALKNFEWTDKQEFTWDMKNTNMDVTSGASPDQIKMIAQLYIKNNGQENTDWNGEG